MKTFFLFMLWRTDSEHCTLVLSLVAFSLRIIPIFRTQTSLLTYMKYTFFTDLLTLSELWQLRVE